MWNNADKGRNGSLTTCSSQRYQVQTSSHTVCNHVHPRIRFCVSMKLSTCMTITDFLLPPCFYFCLKIFCGKKEDEGRKEIINNQRKEYQSIIAPKMCSTEETY
mmetsp:Transcript_19621/g.22725  ORF Transcript_19621/g.22725 Transcript_19621/m.22725 type:complete len:104 (-) Transcript_19621:262-573(-)